MEQKNDGAGADTPVQDRALAALAQLLETIGEEAIRAFVGADDAAFADCTRRAEAVVRCIISLPAVTLRGAAAKADAARAAAATRLLEQSLVDRLAQDMHSEVCRLRAPMEGGHA